MESRPVIAGIKGSDVNIKVQHEEDCGELKNSSVS